MKVVILYHPNSEQERIVTDYMRDYHRIKGESKSVELRSLETVEGAHTAKLYDVTRYPALLALTNDGQLLKLWQDEHLPLFNEVDAYAAS